jgi:hypothetical protein
MILPASAIAITPEGCRHQFDIRVPSGAVVLVDLRFRPDQRVNIAFGQPGGGGDAAEWELRTTADGTLRRSFSAADIGRTGQVMVVVTTTGEVHAG